MIGLYLRVYKKHIRKNIRKNKAVLKAQKL